MKRGFTVYNFAQGSPEWHQIRKGKLTMSNAAAAIGMSRFESPETLADYLTGRKEKVFSEKSLQLMKMGSEREVEMRDWYCQEFPERKVSEIGFAVPDWCPQIGCSPDGLVDDDGIIEIKHVVNFNKSTLTYFNSPGKKKMIDYIPESHYVQIQGNLGILKRKWCDYIVKEFDGGHLMIRIPFNRTFWVEVQKPRMLEFVAKYLTDFEADCPNSN